MMFIIAFVSDAKITKRNVTDNRVKEAVGNIRLFKGLCRY